MATNQQQLDADDATLTQTVSDLGPLITSEVSALQAAIAKEVTAVVVVSNKGGPYDGQVGVQLYADYADGRNREWAKNTPSLGLTMTVKQEIADEHFPIGQSFLLTFTPQEAF